MEPTKNAGLAIASWNFFMPLVGIVFRLAIENGALAQALNSNDRGPWNVSAPFFNQTRLSGLASLGHKSGNQPNVSSNAVLWPSLDVYNDLLDQCLLWDNQCFGNRTKALDLFFNNSGSLYNLVYGAHCIWSRVPKCSPWLPSPALLPKLLDWLRQPDCVHSFYAYHTQHADRPAWTWSRRTFDGWSVNTIDWSTISTTTSNVGCCGQCTIFGGNVDVYYWPTPGANSGCVSAIGSVFNDPAAELLVTDDRGFPYWKIQSNPWGQSDSQNAGGVTIPAEQAFPNGGVNPLSAPTYIVQARDYGQYNTTIAANVSVAEAIATINDFRCTSPSVCVGFSNIYAADGCGVLSTDGELIPYTIIAFAPGELSTIQAPAWVRASDPPKAAIKAFNFADLPCPPSSVMYAVEYKPALGEPYRPVLSAPSRLSSLLPEWSRSGCVISAALFNGVDPPRALKAAEILTPRVTQALPSASAAAAAAPAPASGIRASEPKKTLNPSKTGNLNPVTEWDPETTESGSQLSDPPSSDPNRANPNNENSKTSSSRISVVVDSNPDKVDPHDTVLAKTDPRKGAAGASQPKPSPESFNPKHATLKASDPQDVEPQASDTIDEPENPQGSSFAVSKADDPNADSSNDNRFQLTNGELQDGAKAPSYGSESSPIPDSDPGPATYIRVDGHTIAVQANEIAIAGETLHPGDPGITVDGSPISLGSSEFIVGDHTESFSLPTAITASPAYVTVNGEPVSVGSGSVVVGGITLKPGESSVTIHGKPVFLGASGIVVGGVTGSLELGSFTAMAASSYTTLNGEIITIGVGDIVIGGTTLKPGEPGITIDGKLVSLAPSSVIIGRVTASLEFLGATMTSAPSYIIVNGERIAIGADDVVVGGSTLTAGSPGITVDGKLVSLGSANIVVGSTTELLALSGSLGGTRPSYITFDGETVSVGAGSVVVDGKTLMPGGSPVTVDGTIISLGSSVLVVGTRTTRFSLPSGPTTSSSGEGVGAMILSGLGGMGGETVPVPGNDVVGLNGSGNSNGVVPFVGKAVESLGPVGRWYAWAVSLIALVLWA